MNQKTTTRILLVLLAVATIGCKKKMMSDEPEVDATQIRNEIQTMETAYATGMTMGDLDGISYYADDATSFPHEQAPAVGKMEIVKNMKSELASLPKGVKATYVTNEVFPSNDGEHVLEVGNYKVSDSTNAVISSGNFLAYFEKRDGKYVCIRDISTPDRPKESNSQTQKK